MCLVGAFVKFKFIFSPLKEVDGGFWTGMVWQGKLKITRQSCTSFARMDSVVGSQNECFGKSLSDADN